MSKFEALLENTLVRYQRSQFLTGDLIKFKKNWQKNGWVQANPDFAQKIMQFIESGDNLRVSAVKSFPSSVQGSYGSYENEQANLIDITQEFAPGLYKDFMTVPSNIIEVVDTGNNLAPVPDSKKRKDNTTLKPEDVKIQSGKGKPFSQERQTAVDDTAGDRKLHNKNVKLPHGNKWNDKKPGAGNTKGLKKVKESFQLPKNDSDLIFEAYMSGDEDNGQVTPYEGEPNPEDNMTHPDLGGWTVHEQSFNTKGIDPTHVMKCTVSKGDQSIELSEFQNVWSINGRALGMNGEEVADKELQQIGAPALKLIMQEIEMQHRDKDQNSDIRHAEQDAGWDATP